MAISPDLVEALNQSIDRLQQGETIDEVLNQYPAQAGQLRPMLEAGALFQRVRYTPAEVTAAQNRIEPAVQQAAEAAFKGGLRGTWPGLLLLVVIVSGGMILAIFATGQGNDKAAPDTLSPTSTMTSTAITTEMPVMPAAVATSTAIPTITTRATEATPTITAIPTSTAPDQPPIMVIEGPVEAITEDSVTIFDIVIKLDPDDPLLNAVSIGDVLRIEGEYLLNDATVTITVINITFVEIDAYVNDDENGTVWREDAANCNNPPPDWAPANGWRRRCEGTNNASSGRGNNGRGNNDDD